MHIVVIGLSHHSSPVTVREKFAFSEARVPAALQSMREAGLVEEAVILSTCNRVEIYAATSLESGPHPRLPRPDHGRDLQNH
jgi:glutamyl-tRNA reductase